MSPSLRYPAVASSIVALAMVVIVGCGQPTPTPQAAGDSASASSPAAAAASPVKTPEPVKASEPAKVAATAEEHPHIAGAHGGIVIPIGADSYHAEAVIEKDGQIRLLTLGADETRIQEVDFQTLKAYVKPVGDTDATPIEMTATPQDGDPAGKTSQFVGQLPAAAVGKAIDVTIPNLRIGNERFRVGFTTSVVEHDNGMPAAVTGDDERELYLTPAGKYTLSDIEANGHLTASQKFKGVTSKHDMKPSEGDLICPVTFTKANPNFEWIVDGKSYLFCCPPCVDEFVRMAKEEPDELKAPEEYIQR